MLIYTDWELILCIWLVMNELEQWPGSYCDTKQGCCFPIHGAPGAFFGIHGLWPNYNDGSYPESCGGEPFSPNTVCNRLILLTLHLQILFPQFLSWDRNSGWRNFLISLLVNEHLVSISFFGWLKPKALTWIP